MCVNFIIQELSQTSGRNVIGKAHLNSLESVGETSIRSKYGHFFKKAASQWETYQPTMDDNSKLLRAKLDAYVEDSSQFSGASTSAKSTSAFDYWTSKHEIYGELAFYALNLLIVPASSAGIERVFSLAGIVQGNLRHRLGAGSMEREFMIKVNRNFLMKM